MSALARTTRPAGLQRESAPSHKPATHRGRARSEVRRRPRKRLEPLAQTGRVSTLLAMRVQRATRISSPEDPAEREAEETARKIVRMPSPLLRGTGGSTAVVDQGSAPAARAESPESGETPPENEPAEAAPEGAEAGSEPEPLGPPPGPPIGLARGRRSSRPPLIARSGRPTRIERTPRAAAAGPARAGLNSSSILRRASRSGPLLTVAAAPMGTTPAARTVAPDLEAEIGQATTSGNPLSPELRSAMEPRFGADFGPVRVHRDERAGRLSARLGARAFTFGRHVFFGRGEYQPEREEGAELVAHELTHTIQQGAVVQRAADTAVAADATTGPETRISQPAPRQVQRWGIGDALDYFAGHANLIPGFRMLTLLLGINPINMRRVDRSAANFLRALVELLPGGGLITQALDAHGVFDRAGAWVERQIRSLGLSAQTLRNAVDEFLEGLSWTSVFSLGGVWRDAQRIFTEPIDRIKALGRTLIDGIIDFVRDAILQPLAERASQTEGWDLLCAVIGSNPITGETVPRTAENLIGGFMRLIGREEVWQNIQRGNAVARAWAWFQGALAELMGFVRQIPSLFLQALRDLEVADIILIPRAFLRVSRVFGSFAVRFILWSGRQVFSLLQIIFEVVAPQVMVYIRRAGGALRTIIENPIAFVRNLVRAGELGFRQFAGNILTHLRTALIGWLTGTMSGANIYIPQGFNVREILKFVLSVLGLTWQNIRRKLVRRIGERAVVALETGFALVQTLVTEGPAAAWQQILEGIGNLRDMVMEQIITYVRNRIVVAAVTRLASMINPVVGGIVQVVLGIYNTVMFFVERLQQIAQVGMAVIDSIAAIARGAIGPAANRVEQTMVGMLTLAISFLARLVGLGNVAQAVTRIINRLRRRIDRALDRVVAWIVRQARRVGRAARSALGGRDTRSPEEKRRDLDRAARELRPHIEPMLRRGISRLMLRARMAVWKRRYRLTNLGLIGGKIRAVINPQVDMFSTEEQETGRGLEQILQAAEAAFLAAHGQREDVQARLAAARQAIADRTPLPANLTQADLVVLYRELPDIGPDGDFVVEAPGYQLQIAKGRFQVLSLSSYLFRHLPGMPQGTQVTLPEKRMTGVFRQRGAASWQWGRNDPIVNEAPQMDPRVSGLRDHVEVTRAEGALAASTVAQALANLAGAAGPIPVVADVNLTFEVTAADGSTRVETLNSNVSIAEITFGRLAPLAGPSTAGAGTHPMERSATQGPNEQAAVGQRHGTYAVIFNTLSAAVQRVGRDALVKLPGGQGAALLEVTQAYDDWRRVAIINGQLQSDESNNAIPGAANRLSRAIQGLMASMQQQG